jgi:acetyl-CoA decarbonylase/synthase complex subunit delta
MDLREFLRKHEIQELSGVRIEGDIEIIIASPAPPELTLEKASFSYSPQQWKNRIEEVVLGGGNRKEVRIGGESTLPYYNFEGKMPNIPAISIDVFDLPIKLAKAVRENYQDVMEDPAEWAKRNVRYGADLVAIHLVSTDPFTKNTSAREAAATVEEILQAVSVPVIIGGSGNPEKDPEVLELAAERAKGERCLIASANLGLDYERIAASAIKNGHALLSFTPMDINQQKLLNRYLLKLGVPRNSLIMDPTTASIGYGLDYAFTNFERIRIEGLKGDRDLSFPIMCAASNAWGAREAWMKESPVKEDTEWGPRGKRGILWEVITALSLALAGADIFMMSHPESVKMLRETLSTLFGKGEPAKINIGEWITRI